MLQLLVGLGVGVYGHADSASFVAPVLEATMDNLLQGQLQILTLPLCLV